jgi:pimeloyl-ACP methyl ester carboxylesterase
MDLILDGKRVFAGTGGRGFDTSLPAVFLLHGAGMDHSVWAMQARWLAHHGRTVLALDLPGHGGSDGPPLSTIETMAHGVLEVAAALEIEQLRLVGHSMGALVALAAAAHAGTQCDGLALLGLTPEMKVHPDLLAAARAGEHRAIDLMVSWSLPLASQLGANPAAGLRVGATMMRLLERGAGSLGSDLAACDAYRGATAAAGEVKAASLLILGGADRMAPSRAAVAFAQRLPGGRTTLLPGIGHMMMLEDPAATLAALQGIV